MVSKALVVKNSTLEGPGLIEHVFSEYGIFWDMVDLDRGDKFTSLEEYKAVFVLGGPDSANDKTSKIIRELEIIRQVFDREIPYLGICLGMQLMVKANEGTVLRCRKGEVGWRDSCGRYYRTALTREGRKDLLFYGIEKPVNVLQLHNEKVELGKNMKLLGTGRYCRNQIVKIGSRAYGIQGHIELTRPMLDDWINHIIDLAHVEKSSIMDDYNNIRSGYEKVGKKIIENFLSISGLIR
jgi:GMP synthase-like glutamine amidotransferase